MTDDTTHAATRAARIGEASKALRTDLEAGRAISKGRLRKTMTQASDGADDWSWRDAYDAVETAEARLLTCHGPALLARAAKAAGESRLDRALYVLERLVRLERLEPKQTERTAEQVSLQQFSTPLPLAWSMVASAGIRAGDVVLEPSAGTGMLAVLAGWFTQGPGTLQWNEIAATRRAVLAGLLPGAPSAGVDAERIDTHWTGSRPNVVLMNPPAAGKGANGRMRRNVDAIHTAAAWRALAPGGRLVTLTTEGFAPGSDKWQGAFREETTAPLVVTSEQVDGKAFERHGTRYNARITMIRKPYGDGAATAEERNAAAVEDDAAKALRTLIEAT